MPRPRTSPLQKKSAPRGPRSLATLPLPLPSIETRQGPLPNTPAPQAMRTAGGVTDARVSGALLRRRQCAFPATRVVDRRG